jgi:hypothetical protein
MKSDRRTEVFETTLGELITALLEAAEEVSTDVREIESLAYQTLSSLLSSEPRIQKEPLTKESNRSDLRA